MKTHYDVVVIGAGSGGLTAAVGLTKIGKSVLLIERATIGGECTNSGCIPSKALLHHAKTYAAAIAISSSNSHTEHYQQAAFSYVRSKITETLAHETPEYFEKIGITIIQGEAVFVGPRTITVNHNTYQFKKAIIATGSSPRLIEIPGLDHTRILTNQNLFNLESVPLRTLIIGAGPIGMEMGQALALLGSTVTILDNGPTFAKGEDAAIQTVIAQSFRDTGITILQNAAIINIEGATAYIKQAGVNETTVVQFDTVLMAIGRVPNIPHGLTAARITYDSTGVAVNPKYQTTNKRVYAIGDVAGRLKFTHVADDVARSVVTHIATFGLLRSKNNAVPKVTYTEPELAQVGLTQTEAETTYGVNSIFRIEVPVRHNDRARTDNAERGMLVVIVKRLSGKILGAHIACAYAGELIAIFTLAIDNNLSLWKLRRTIYAYPTYSLIIKKAGDYFFATQISTLKADLALQAKKVAPKIILAGLWVFGLYTLYLYQTQNNLTATDSALRLFDFITLSLWGPVLYILAYSLRPITFLPATILTVLSGVFFGLYEGVLYTFIGANLSASLAYGIGRFFGSSTPSSKGGLFSRLATACRTHPFITILTMRLTFLPYDAVNYGAGFIKVPYLPYISATIVGSVLGIVTFVAIGASLSIEEFKTQGVTSETIDSRFLLLSVTVFVISLIVARLLKK